jgi:hypothetical protein
MTDASATRSFGIVRSRQCWPAAAIGSRGGPILAVPQDLALRPPLIAAAVAWLWQRPPWGYLLIGATLVFWGPGKHRRRGGPVFGHAAGPASSQAGAAGHVGLRGARAHRADTRPLPVPQPPGQGARTQEPPITSRWLSTAPAACDPSNLANRDLQADRTHADHPVRYGSDSSGRAAIPARIAAGTRAVIWSVDRASQSRMAAWMVVRSVYSCIDTLGVNIRICRVPDRLSGAAMMSRRPPCRHQVLGL